MNMFIIEYKYITRVFFGTKEQANISTCDDAITSTLTKCSVLRLTLKRVKLHRDYGFIKAMKKRHRVTD